MACTDWRYPPPPQRIVCPQHDQLYTNYSRSSPEFDNPITPFVVLSPVFRDGPFQLEQQVDLVCCLVSKHEQPGGGAGSLAEVHVSDGSGLASPWPRKKYDKQRDAALLKGIRTALGQPDWSPNKSQSQRAPIHLRVEVIENKKEVS